MGCCGSKTKSKNEPTAEPLASGSNADDVQILASPPSGATKHHCHHVYDGDTLTLDDRRRVRFLGIDTPELKEKEPFSEEARDLTHRLCHKKDVWLVQGEEAEDKYGRLLAFVYAAVDGGYICVNEALVHAGFAGFYSVGSELPNKRALLQHQRRARLRGAGMWHAFADIDVVATPNGRCFHLRDCKHVEHSRHLRTVKKGDAIDEGLSSCRDCHP